MHTLGTHSSGFGNNTFSVLLKFLLDHPLSLPSRSSRCSEIKVYSLIFLYSFIVNTGLLTQYVVLFCMFKNAL